MDYRLEWIDRVISEQPEDFDALRELAFATAATNVNDPDTYRWVAVCAALYADELDS